MKQKLLQKKQLHIFKTHTKYRNYVEITLGTFIRAIGKKQRKMDISKIKKKIHKNMSTGDAIKNKQRKMDISKIKKKIDKDIPKEDAIKKQRQK